MIRETFESGLVNHLQHVSPGWRAKCKPPQSWSDLFRGGYGSKLVSFDIVDDIRLFVEVNVRPKYRQLNNRSEFKNWEHSRPKCQHWYDHDRVLLPTPIGKD